jgi:hypothetical protein
LLILGYAITTRHQQDPRLQREIVRNLERDGHDARLARQLLLEFERSLDLHRQDHARIEPGSRWKLHSLSGLAQASETPTNNRRSSLARPAAEANSDRNSALLEDRLQGSQVRGLGHMLVKAGLLGAAPMLIVPLT